MCHRVHLWGIPIIAATILFSSPVKASQSLDIVMVMDNSSSMPENDSDLYSISSAQLLIDLMRPEDNFYLISSGATARLVLVANGKDKDAIKESISMMKWESYYNDFLEVFKSLKDFVQNSSEKNKAVNENSKSTISRKTIVIWFMSPELRFGSSKPISKKKNEKEEGKKIEEEGKEISQDRRKIFLEEIEESAKIAQILKEKGIELNVFVPHSLLFSQGLQSEEVTSLFSKVVSESGGRLIFLKVDGGFVLDRILSVFIRAISAPTETINETSYNTRGEKFEVYRKSENLWAVILFEKSPPRGVSMTFKEYTSTREKKWPFGKSNDEALFKKPDFEKGVFFRSKRWFKPPENPLGYGLFMINKPVEGIYTLSVKFVQGERFIIKIFQDVGLELGFLVPPPASLSLGTSFHAIAGLRGSGGESFSLHRSFVEGLKFSFEIINDDGTKVAHIDSDNAKLTREGEAQIIFEPPAAGIYYLKGEVTHRNEEFFSRLQPFKFEVYYRMKLEILKQPIFWNAPARKGEWITISPGIQIEPGADIPDNLSLDLKMDWSGVKNLGLLEIRPKDYLHLQKGKTTYPLRIRYRNPENLRRKRIDFRGYLRLYVTEEQKKVIAGSGSWFIPVNGRLTPWTFWMYWDEYHYFAQIFLLFIIITLFVIERKMRPSFKPGLILCVMVGDGVTMRSVKTLNLSSVRKSIIPFLRQKARIGTDGSINSKKVPWEVLIFPESNLPMIRSYGKPVYYREFDGGNEIKMGSKFEGKTSGRYIIGEGKGKIEFWFQEENKR